MNKYNFLSEYKEGFHPAILKALERTNLEPQLGYGEDKNSLEAKELLKNKMKNMQQLDWLHHMKTIGLIGGMGWESSKLYYDRINKKTNSILGGSHSAKIIMVSVDFAEIEILTFANDWDAIGNIVATSAQQLERAGADIVVLCTNLIHIVSDYIKKSISIPFLHIADTTGKAIQKLHLKRNLLLGTKLWLRNYYS